MEYGPLSNRFNEGSGSKIPIGKLAELVGLSKDTIRFYEKRGLIRAENGSPGRGRCKHYTQETLQRLALIRTAKSLGFTLSQIERDIEAWESGQLSWDSKIALIQKQIELVDEKLQHLQAIKTHLLEKLRCLEELKSTERKPDS